MRWSSTKRRQTLHSTQVDDAQDQRAIARRTAADVVTQIAGLPVRDLKEGNHTGYELLVEVAFADMRRGRLTVGFSQGLTSQVGASMALMVDMDGKPLNAVAAAKDLTRAIVHAVLGAIFGADFRPRLHTPQATKPRLFGEQASVLGVADGHLAIDLHLDQSRI